MKGKAFLVALSFSMILWLNNFSARGENTIYVYLNDKKGVLAFTNVPTERGFRPYFFSSRRRTRVHRVDRSRLIERIEEIIQRVSWEERVEPALVKAVVKVESDFDPYAISPKGALGLMQLMEDTSLRMVVTNRLDPEQNIRGGVRYLKYLLRLFQGDLALALAAYNLGENRVKKKGEIPEVQETRRFVTRVLRYLQKYRKDALEEKTHNGGWRWRNTR